MGRYGKFQYAPEWSTLEHLLREAMDHDHEDPSGHHLDELVQELLQRDRQLEDYLLALSKRVTAAAAPRAPNVCRLELSVFPGNNRPIPTGTTSYTTLNFDSIVENNLGAVVTNGSSGPTTVITPAAGKYGIFTKIVWNSNAVGIRDTAIQDTYTVGGLTDVAQNAVVDSFPTVQQPMWFGFLPAGDPISVGVKQDSGTTVDVVAYSWISVTYFGP